MRLQALILLIFSTDMKKYILMGLFLCALFLQKIHAQKHDNIWPMGYDGDTAIAACNYYMDFSADTLQIVPFCLGAEFMSTVSAISDSMGNLLFYTNNAKVVDRSHQLMMNGNNLNNNIDTFAEEDGYYTESLILPTAGRPGIYHIFHIQLGDDEILSGYALRLNHSVVDLTLNGGLGAVTIKNDPILRDTLGGWGNLLEAVKHANGEDWWILIPKNGSNIYYRFLLTADSLYGPYTQAVGPAFHWIDYNGQAVFSPDGRLYARYDPYNEGELYSVNRCTGELTHLQHIDVPSHVNAGGAAISQNSRFLYIANDTILFQYDLTATNINTTRITIAKMDSFQCPQGFFVGFYQMQLAPDGKIYGVSVTTSACMHVMDYPDSLGLACSFRQRAVEIPPFNRVAIPNFPHFRTPAIPCDTASAVVPLPVAEGIKLYPNPAANALNIELRTGETQLLSVEIYSLTGQKIKSYGNIGRAAFQISLEEIPSGLYLCRINTSDHETHSFKLSIIK